MGNAPEREDGREGPLQRVEPADGSALAEFSDTDDARRIAALEADRDLLDRLIWARYAGPEYEIFPPQRRAPRRRRPTTPQVPRTPRRSSATSSLSRSEASALQTPPTPEEVVASAARTCAQSAEEIGVELDRIPTGSPTAALVVARTLSVVDAFCPDARSRVQAAALARRIPILAP